MCPRAGLPTCLLAGVGRCDTWVFLHTRRLDVPVIDKRHFVVDFAGKADDTRLSAIYSYHVLLLGAGVRVTSSLRVDANDVQDIGRLVVVGISRYQRHLESCGSSGIWPANGFRIIRGGR